MKRVLFVTFFWPPSGKATAHWPLGMARHLPAFGWLPHVLTADRDSFAQPDPTLVEKIGTATKVDRARAFEPFGLYRQLLGRPKDEPLLASEAISLDNRTLQHRLAIWVRMNLFAPDARVGWYLDAVRVGRRLLKTNPMKAIISVGPPHTTHLVAKTISADFRIPHIPVFIDPWVDIVYYKNFKRNRLILSIDRRMEESVLRNAASAVFVTQTMRDHYLQKFEWLTGKAHVLYWGFNEEDFTHLKSEKEKHTETLLHTGNIFDYQNPVALWSTIKREVKKGRDLRLVFVGSVSPGIKRSIDDAGLQSRTTYKGFLPYGEAVRELMRATYLLVCATERRHVPGKLFEYLRAGKPILAFGDDNAEVERFLKKENAGMLFPYNSDAREFFGRAKGIRPGKRNLSAYTRRSIARELASILDNIQQASEVRA